MLMAIAHRNPRRGLWVNMNHVPMMGPVSAPIGERKNPRINVLNTVQATICAGRSRRRVITMMHVSISYSKDPDITGSSPGRFDVQDSSASGFW